MTPPAARTTLPGVSLPPRFRRVRVLPALLVFAVGVLLAVAGCRSAPATPRVIVLGFDGMDPVVVDLLMSEGKLPHFAKMRQEGAYGRLQSSRPLLSPVVWTTIATGKTPDQHRIGHFLAQNPKTGQELPVTSRMRQAKALWNIFSDTGRSAAVVGWWATWPAETVRGAIVSDHLCYHFLMEEGATKPHDEAGLTWPPELMKSVSPLVRRPADLTADDLAPFVHVTAEQVARPFDFNDDLSHFKWVLATAESYRRIGLKLWSEVRPDIELVYVEGTDSTSHLFGHLFRAGPMSGELAGQQAQFGDAVEQMYIYADRFLGDFMEAMDERTALIVLSDHGFELGVLQNDPSKTRDMRRVSEEFHNIQGILYMYGHGVKPHARLDQAAILDVAPTVLALAGIPPAADMRGRVLSEAIDRPILSPVPTYEPAARPSGGAAVEGDAEVDPQILERLRSLGYLQETSPSGDRNLAAVLFDAGKYQEAEQAYRRLVAAKPEDGGLRTSLAGTLGALGKYDEAMEQLDAAIKLEPLNPEAYHNRAVIHERRGEREAAVRDYRTALRYSPQYGPSRQALARLGAARDRGGVGRCGAAAREQDRAAGERGRAPGRLPRSDEEAGRGAEDRAPLCPDLPVPVERRLPDGGPRGGDRGAPQGARARAGQRALPGKPQEPADNAGAARAALRERSRKSPTIPAPRPGRARPRGSPAGPAALPPLALAAAVFALYAAGACRTIYVGDSGELVTAVDGLGIPHPSGYPLYVLLGKLWTLLVPAGSIALRMSLFSAACAAASCGVLFLLARRMALGPVAAVTGALMLAFGPSLWAEANVQRVYALNLLFVVLATAAAWRWAVKGSDRSLAAAFLLCGIGATNHTFMAVYAAALFLHAAVSDPALARRPLRLVLCASAFAPGLLPYLYLPLRSRMNPRLDWGNPETIESFLRVVLRRGFLGETLAGGARRPAPDRGRLPAGDGPRAGLGGGDPGDRGAGGVAVETRAARGRPRGRHGCGPDARHRGRPDARDRRGPAPMSGVDPAPASGAAAREGRRRRLFVLLPVLVMAANLAALALHGSHTDIFVWHRYYIPSYAMGALLAAIGAHALVSALPRPARLAPLLLPLLLLAWGWRANDRSRYRIGEDFSSLVLASVAPGAHLAAEDDNILFTLMYLHLVEKKRPDIDLIMEGVGGEALPPLRFDPDSDPLYFTHHPNWDLPELAIVPMGVVFKACRADRPRPEPVIQKRRLDGEDDPRVPKDFLTQNLVGHFHYMLGVTLIERDWPEARRELERAKLASPDNDVLFYNLGLIYSMNGLLDEAAEAFGRSHAINPRHLANLQRSQASDKLAEIEAEKRRIDLVTRELESSDAALGSLRPGTPAFLRRLADDLRAKGENLAARGCVLRAVELEAQPGTPAP